MASMILQKPCNPLKKWVEKRIHKENSNAVILFTGNPGTGKTYSALTMAGGLHHLFSIDFICFGVKDLLTLLLHILKTPVKFKGAVILYEEPQDDVNNKRSSSKEAVIFTNILSTFRSMNCVLIITTPKEAGLTKDARSYADVWLVTEYINRDAQYCSARVKFGEWSEVSKKTLWKYLRVYCIEMKKAMKLTRIEFGKPGPEFITFYEARKGEYQKASYNAMLRELEMKEKKHSEEKQGKCKQCASNFGYITKKGWLCRACGYLTKQPK